MPVNVIREIIVVYAGGAPQQSAPLEGSITALITMYIGLMSCYSCFLAFMQRGNY